MSLNKDDIRQQVQLYIRHIYVYQNRAKINKHAVDTVNILLATRNVLFVATPWPLPGYSLSDN